MFSNKNDAVEAKLENLARQMASLQDAVLGACARPRGAALLTHLGVTPDRFLDRYFSDKPDNDLYEALYGGSESIRGYAAPLGLTSGVCRQLHYSLDEFRYWSGRLDRKPRMHRKEWELFYIAQALFERDMLRPGKKGLVFAVGAEPLPALFATFGCEILASDQAQEQAIEGGWVQGGMYASTLESIHYDHICPRDRFFESVSYRNIDMNDVPADLEGKFDFCWSACAFEHLGSLEHGLRFVERSIDTLVPGGVAVHTTEFNLSSNGDTLESPNCSIYRRRDMEELTARLTVAGHQVEPFDWATGKGVAETVIDLPPYKQSPHLILQVASYECTSIGIIVRKGGA